MIRKMLGLMFHEMQAMINVDSEYPKNLDFVEHGSFMEGLPTRMIFVYVANEMEKISNDASLCVMYLLRGVLLMLCNAAVPQSFSRKEPRC